MKTKTFFLTGISVMALLACGYAILETMEEKASTSSTGDTIAKTTSSTTTTTTKSKTTTTRAASKPATNKTYKTCKAYCKGIGYEGGECRMNTHECRVRKEVKSVYGSRLCPTVKENTCCCQTENSMEMDSKYSFGILTSVNPETGAVITADSKRTTNQTKQEIRTITRRAKTAEEEMGILEEYEGQYEALAEYYEDYGTEE